MFRSDLSIETLTIPQSEHTWILGRAIFRARRGWRDCIARLPDLTQLFAVLRCWVSGCLLTSGIKDFTCFFRASAH